MHNARYGLWPTYSFVRCGIHGILQTETVNTNDGILKRACVNNLIS